MIDATAEFAAALAEHLSNGAHRATRGRRAARIDICLTCPSGDFQLASPAQLSTCRECGCFVYLKAQWAEQRCPKSHWPGDDPAKWDHCCR